MGRVLKTKELINTKLATTYGGWMYCTSCNKNIGYLCYVTYDKLNLHYECGCGSKGSALLNFDDSKAGEEALEEIILVKNRFCCPRDSSPLITILSQNVKSYQLEITCKACGKIYQREHETVE